MKIAKTLSPELLCAARALRRAAIKVKLEAERSGAPYVVAAEKGKVADKPVLNRSGTLQDVSLK